MLCALLASLALQDASEPIARLDAGLAIKGVARGGRSPVRSDPIEEALVRGTLVQPAAGAPAFEGGPAWSELKAKEGAFAADSLVGGYLWCTYESPEERPALLAAQGDAAVYVNGELRAGDPYSWGFVHIPLRLKQGPNTFLFAHARGELRAELLPAAGEAFLSARDATLPDLVVGQGADTWMGVLVTNPSTTPLFQHAITAEGPDGTVTVTQLPTIAPLSNFKACVRLRCAPASGERAVPIALRLIDAQSMRRGDDAIPEDPPLSSLTIELKAVRPDAKRRETFVSAIDGSCQYYALVPALPGGATPPGIVLSLHGASVEATSQARCYAPREWCFVVAPTNRRPFGFDWEDWGRIDAMEALAAATSRHANDPRGRWLTGHSMGGHGTWQVGGHLAGRFAAIAPSAGWVSFWTYGAGGADPPPTPVGDILRRAANPSRTLLLMPNYASGGVYILHGTDDDNVPVEQARMMRAKLGNFHPDFAYHEQPGAGHWWGDQCVDWPPLMDFLSRRKLPEPDAVRAVDFVTVSPAINATSGFVTIAQQVRPMEPSRASVTLDASARRIAGTTSNVALLGLDADLDGDDATITIDLDGQSLQAREPDGGDLLWFRRAGETWAVGSPPGPGERRPGRYGPFKGVFDRGAVLVVGTKGTPEETAWAQAKARYDAEQFWVRGNGALQVVDDVAYLAARKGAKDPYRGRNAILYGNGDTNAAWGLLLAGSPVDVRRGEVRVGEDLLAAKDLACIMARPSALAGDDDVLVGIVSGSGIAGMRLTERMPYFVAGVAYPDFFVAAPEFLHDGYAGVRAAGFFGNTWELSPAETALQGAWEREAVGP